MDGRGGKGQYFKNKDDMALRREAKTPVQLQSGSNTMSVCAVMLMQ